MQNKENQENIMKDPLNNKDPKEPPKRVEFGFEFGDMNASNMLDTFIRNKKGKNLRKSNEQGPERKYMFWSFFN